MKIRDESNPDEHKPQNEDDILTVTENKQTNNKEKMKLLLKLHQHFRHASVDAQIILIMTAH